MHTSPPFLPIISLSLLYLSQVSFSFYNSNQNILSLPNTIVRAVICTFVGNHERLQRTLFSEPLIQTPYQSSVYLFIKRWLSSVGKVLCHVLGTQA